MLSDGRRMLFNKVLDKISPGLHYKVKQALCLCDRLRKVHEGICVYQKGSREIVRFYGSIYICDECDKEHFAWKT